jgi:CRISPR/Cas system-associated exonuclease Cas4 (RecB family)
VRQALLLAGLEPNAGFLHADRPGKPSLSLDLIEEFRQAVVDRTLIGQVNRGFAIVQDEGGRLDGPTRKRIVEKVLERMRSTEPYEGKRRSLRTYGLTRGERAFDVGLRSAVLGLRGRLDLAIAVPDRAAPGAEAIVVEYKDSEKAAGPHFKLQLTAYALLLEEAWGLPVRRGFIYSIPLRTAEIVSITPALQSKVRQTVEAMRVAIAGERMPEAPASRRPV